MNLKKKRIRIVAIIALVIVCVAAVVMGLNFEPSDYGKTLSKKIDKAKETALAVEIGNNNEQYAAYTQIMFENEIKAARMIADDEDSTYEEEKSVCEKLDTAIDNYFKSANAHSVDRESIKEDTFEAVLSGKTSFVWKLDKNSFTNGDALNPDVKEEGPYYNRIFKYIEKFSMQGQIFSSFHNGDMPGEFEITMDFYNKGETTGYLYKFNHDTNMLEFMSEAVLNGTETDATATFKLSSGGDYVLLLSKLEDYATEEQLQEIASEIKDTADTIDIPVVKSAVNDMSQVSEDEISASSFGSTTDKSTSSPSGEKSTTGSSPQTTMPAETPTTSQPETKAPDVATPIRVCIEIRCDNLSNDISKLEDPSLEPYVPLDGVILGTTYVDCTTANTVFDVLNFVCRNNNIQISSRYTPMYGSYYVEGINYLYEFNGGSLSGWMYKVNGWYPNYGCSSYYLKDGDVISWNYTCDCGVDLGEPMY